MCCLIPNIGVSSIGIMAKSLEIVQFKCLEVDLNPGLELIDR